MSGEVGDARKRLAEAPPIRPDVELIDNAEGNKRILASDRAAARVYLDKADAPTPADEARAETATECVGRGCVVDRYGRNAVVHTYTCEHYDPAPVPVVPAEPEVDEVLALGRIFHSWLKPCVHPVGMDEQCVAWAKTVLAAGYLSSSQVRARERAAWELGFAARHQQGLDGFRNGPATNPFAGGDGS